MKHFFPDLLKRNKAILFFLCGITFLISCNQFKSRNLMHDTPYLSLTDDNFLLTQSKESPLLAHIKVGLDIGLRDDYFFTNGGHNKVDEYLAKIFNIVRSRVFKCGGDRLDSIQNGIKSEWQRIMVKLVWEYSFDPMDELSKKEIDGLKNFLSKIKNIRPHLAKTMYNRHITGPLFCNTYFYEFQKDLLSEGLFVLSPNNCPNIKKHTCLSLLTTDYLTSINYKIYEHFKKFVLKEDINLMQLFWEKSYMDCGQKLCTLQKDSLNDIWNQEKLNSEEVFQKIKSFLNFDFEFIYNLRTDGFMEKPSLEATPNNSVKTEEVYIEFIKQNRNRLDSFIERNVKKLKPRQYWELLLKSLEGSSLYPEHGVYIFRLLLRCIYKNSESRLHMPTDNDFKILLKKVMLHNFSAHFYPYNQFRLLSRAFSIPPRMIVDTIEDIEEPSFNKENCLVQIWKDPTIEKKMCSLFQLFFEQLDTKNIESVLYCTNELIVIKEVIKNQTCVVFFYKKKVEPVIYELHPTPSGQTLINFKKHHKLESNIVGSELFDKSLYIRKQEENKCDKNKPIKDKFMGTSDIIYNPNCINMS